jgi:hypothetical protein
MLKFKPLSDHPKGFVPCVVKRDLEQYLEINGVVQHGVKERRSQYIIAVYSGQHFLGREAHWSSYAEIPPEGSEGWFSAKLFAPPDLTPVLAILPQPVVLKTLIIPAGLHFAMYEDRSWKIHHRNQGSRISSNEELAVTRCWLDVGKKQVSSWLELPLDIDGRLRSD